MKLSNNYLKKVSVFIIAFCIFVLSVFAQRVVKSKAESQKTGTISGSYVNVRTSAGVNGNSNRLSYQGNYVQLSAGTEITVLSEENDSSGNLWYKVSFEYNDSKLIGYVIEDYVSIDIVYTYDAEFEASLESQGFPESYKVYLRKLHAKYPNWVFKADNLDYDFYTAVNNEAVIGRSLVPATSITSWKSTEEGAYNWDTGVWATFDGSSWVAASKDIIAYCMDPRNFLDETTVFQFELLSYDSSIHNESTVQTLLSDTFMESAVIENNMTYAKAFMEAAEISGVSPYHLASRVIQEVGTKGTTGGVTGYYAPSTGNVYTGLYNYYNIGAYAANGRGAVENGLIYASKTDDSTYRPWNTRYKAIVGGAVFIGNGFINIGQDTIYYEKFDFVGTPYSHQYMTNILAPKSEAVTMSEAYSDTVKKNTALVFKIPVFKNMPASRCECPTGNSTPVKNSSSDSGSTETTTGSGTTTGSTEGTTQSSETTKQTDIGVTTVSEDVVSSVVNVLNNTYVTGIASDSEISAYVQQLVNSFDSYNYDVKIYDKDNVEKTDGYIATGDKIEIYSGSSSLTYTAVIYGDVNGDGSINMLDMAYQKKHILGIQTLEGEYLEAADVSGDGSVNILDMVYLKRHLYGIKEISR